MHKHYSLSILAVVFGLSTVSAQGGIENGCVLPEYPENGHYTVYKRPEASPGQSYDTVILLLTCDPGYRATGTLVTSCFNNIWSQPLPQCTLVSECGRVTSDSIPTAMEGRSALQGEVPWHAVIYVKTFSPYLSICGGSLVSTTMVISAAHCFWDSIHSKLYPSSQYAVGLGKIYKPWSAQLDTGRQTFDVRDVKIPLRFRGENANYQEDIALVFLSRPAEYSHYVRPVCLDFDANFDRRQLEDGKRGKIAGWGLMEKNGSPGQILRVLELPTVALSDCIARVSSDFLQYITSDKFCAGNWPDGKVFCRGDTGGGLVIPERDQFTERFFLRGVASAVEGGHMGMCDSSTIATFTMVSRHELFIKEYMVV